VRSADSSRCLPGWGRYCPGETDGKPKIYVKTVKVLWTRRFSKTLSSVSLWYRAAEGEGGVFPGFAVTWHRRGAPSALPVDAELFYNDCSSLAPALPVHSTGAGRNCVNKNEVHEFCELRRTPRRANWTRVHGRTALGRTLVLFTFKSSGIWRRTV